MKKEKVVIGWSVLTWDEMRSGIVFDYATHNIIKWANYYNDNNYTVTFRTNLFRRLFCKYKYKIVASK